MKYNAINQGHSADVVFLDFQRAFDSVPHNELFIQLLRLGITGPLIDYILSLSMAIIPKAS